MRFYLGKSQKSTNEKSVITRHEGLISRKGTKRGIYETKLHKRKRERGKRTESGRSV